MAKKVQRGFQYKERTKDSLKERANMKGGNFDTYIKPKYKQWKPKDGKNVIRILPPTWDDATHYGFDIYVNFSVGPDKQAYLSLSKHGKGADPLAEARREAQKAGEEKLAKALSPNQRILYWIIDRNDEDEGPLLWAAPFTFDKSLSNLCIDEDTKDVMFIDSPEDGHNVRFYKEGTGINTKYDSSKMKILPASPIHDDEAIQQEWLDFITDNPLPEVLNFYDYEHIEAQFNGQAGDDEETDDEDEDDNEEVKKPTRKPKPAVDDDEPETKPRKVRKPVVEEDDDEPEVKSVRKRIRPEPEDDDEPEVKPRGRQHVASRKHDPVDDEDEDDESPPLTRRTKKPNDDEEGGGSLRDRLARRRSRQTADDDE